MQPSAIDPAFLVCEFIRDYGSIWDRHFPNCARRAHWQIAQLVRLQDDGLLFSIVRGKLDDIYGMDEDTCVLRIQELISEGLAKSDEEHIRSSSCLTPTAQFINLFDRHTVEAVQLLHKTGLAIDPKMPALPRLLKGSKLNKLFFGFFGEFLEIWNEHRLTFLKASISKSPALRLKALRALKTYAYWHIFMTAWIHRHPQGAAKRPYLLVDDFHSAIYEHLGVSGKATTGYVQDMIDWGFLRRLNKNDGVPKGKFAVRMETPVFEAFQNAFAEVADLVSKSARIFSDPSSSDATSHVDSAEVLKFRASR